VSRDRGYIDRRAKLRGLPHIVECPRPPGIGLWPELNAMDDWARGRCGLDGYATTSREDRSGPGLPQTILRVHFARSEDAQAFATAFGLPYDADLK
jgi:hypothetical protein